MKLVLFIVLICSLHAVPLSNVFIRKPNSSVGSDVQPEDSQQPQPQHQLQPFEPPQQPQDQLQPFEPPQQPQDQPQPFIEGEPYISVTVEISDDPVPQIVSTLPTRELVTPQNLELKRVGYAVWDPTEGVFVVTLNDPRTMFFDSASGGGQSQQASGLSFFKIPESALGNNVKFHIIRQESYDYEYEGYEYEGYGEEVISTPEPKSPKPERPGPITQAGSDEESGSYDDMEALPSGEAPSRPTACVDDPKFISKNGYVCQSYTGKNKKYCMTEWNYEGRFAFEFCKCTCAGAQEMSLQLISTANKLQRPPLNMILLRAVEKQA